MVAPITTFDSSASGPSGTLDRSGKPETRRFYGKYRGKVSDNVDPLFLGRIIPIVPAVSPEPLTWAMPCTPYAGEQVGFYTIPPIDANVWIEFEAGDPNLPIWTGCFWEEGQTPFVVPNPDMFIFQTTSLKLVMRDIAGGGGITLELGPPAVEPPITINMSSEGISIVTEATFSVSSATTTMDSDTLTIESPETTLTCAASLEITSGETDLNCDSLDINGGDTNFLLGDFSIESGETNITSAEFTIETPETNIASAAVSIEGTLDVVGIITEDGDPVMVLPIG
ncbi:MAG TPA: phage baseplate assembly protein V [Ktedonobacteraceae bacterium]|nr:phage baseplate assembly protein V [Ktedonobacteraceae bacterium]